MVRNQRAHAEPSEAPPREKYSEPLLLKHESLRDITGQKYGEKTGVEKAGIEKAGIEAG
jgi:hypothetical protein